MSFAVTIASEVHARMRSSSGLAQTTRLRGEPSALGVERWM
jgi:hypothetical protein